MKKLKFFIFILLSVNSYIVFANSTEYTTNASITSYTPNTFKWHILPSGVKYVKFIGDPSKKGEFTVRRLIPAHFNSSPHFHYYDSKITVLSGVLHIGITNKFDKKLTHSYPAGSFLIVPARAVHIVWTDSPVMLQLTEVGPRLTKFINKNSRRWFIGH